MRIISIIGLTVLVWSTPAGAAKGSATDAIRTANGHLRDLLAQKAESPRVTRELRDLFDIADLAKRALVDHWGEMTPAQRTSLVDTLRQVVERNYVSQLRSNLQYEIVYQGEEPQGADVLVKTTIKAERAGRPTEIPVDYLLHGDGGTWRAYDVITDSVSLVTNYRSQFNRIIAKEGVDGLIRRMKSRLDKNDD
jgi:phospholipid transport system substrate-binding protein